jgi:CheY-like chemotaxis protein
MDIQMPVMDGLEATRLIREQPQFATLPIIAMSAGVTLDEQEKCQAAGMSDFIAKPINPLHMLEKISELLIK